MLVKMFSFIQVFNFFFSWWIWKHQFLVWMFYLRILVLRDLPYSSHSFYYGESNIYYATLFPSTWIMSPVPFRDLRAWDEQELKFCFQTFFLILPVCIFFLNIFVNMCILMCIFPIDCIVLYPDEELTFFLNN